MTSVQQSSEACAAPRASRISFAPGTNDIRRARKAGRVSFPPDAIVAAICADAPHLQHEEALQLLADYKQDRDKERFTRELTVVAGKMRVAAILGRMMKQQISRDAGPGGRLSFHPDHIVDALRAESPHLQHAEATRILEHYKLDRDRKRFTRELTEIAGRMYIASSIRRLIKERAAAKLREREGGVGNADDAVGLRERGSVEGE